MAKKKEIEIIEERLIGIQCRYDSPSCIYSTGLDLALDVVYTIIYEDGFYLTTANLKIEILESQITSWFTPVGLLTWNEILKVKEEVKIEETTTENKEVTTESDIIV